MSVPAPAAPAVHPLDAEAVARFQPRYSRPLTPEDGREIRRNLTGFFSILLDWDRAARSAVAVPADGGPR